jgi:hypothetical protein
LNNESVSSQRQNSAEQAHEECEDSTTFH